MKETGEQMNHSFNLIRKIIRKYFDGGTFVNNTRPQSVLVLIPRPNLMI